MTYTLSDISVVILAGGLGRRMGGQDKGLLEFAGKPLIEHVLSQVAPQCGAIYINANRNIEQYARYGHPILKDELDQFQGPLAGFVTALTHASTSLVLTLPCDCPAVPNQLISRLLESLQSQQADIAVAHDGQRLQPVHALIKTSLRDNLQAYLANGDRKIDLWMSQNKTATIDFSDVSRQFANLNSPQDKQQLQANVSDD